MTIADRIAGAPISWGVCEVPGWGHQMAPDRVLTEMRDVGLAATEFGPEGFLPDAPADKADLLRQYGLRAVGGFVPVVLHDPAVDVLATVAPALTAFTAAAASTLVLAADSGATGYDERVELDEDAWRTLLDNLDRIAEAAADRGITATLHPHVGTIVERRADVDRVLDGSRIPLCLDTGHLLIGGTDPVALAAAAPERIAHTHLKDVDDALAARVRAGELTYTDAVRAGMYRPLGQGDIDIAAIVRGLESAGYTGWYVMEQDAILTAEPPADGGPVADVRASLAFLGGAA
ncbi:inosose dehydratase [Hamadaea flava]|uniref:Sugar phosphate isomerase/epimerase family protein n=1 Tax=Hamadaea flava TaxID=1742688 RepID=A0ABV8LVP8_9ACTN|nr:sugar phosphate isomerase/epimerase [Hamadaea flava]MCP2329484.1 inosose dehydratase [Hamadaea flava]